MRSWYPISPVELDNERLLAEHKELFTGIMFYEDWSKLFKEPK